jgi:hypothetical protein
MFAVDSFHPVCSVLRQLCAPAESTLMYRAFPLFLRQHVLLFHVLPDMRRQGLATLFVYVLDFLLAASAAAMVARGFSGKREAIEETEQTNERSQRIIGSWFGREKVWFD